MSPWSDTAPSSVRSRAASVPATTRIAMMTARRTQAVVRKSTAAAPVCAVAGRSIGSRVVMASSGNPVLESEVMSEPWLGQRGGGRGRARPHRMRYRSGKHDSCAAEQKQQRADDERESVAQMMENMCGEDTHSEPQTALSGKP